MAWQPDYSTLAEAKAYVRIPDTADDVEIALAITAASRAIDQATNRQFGLLAAVEDRFYTACWDRRRGRWVIAMDDLMTQTGLIIKVDLQDDQTFTGTVDDFQLLPVNGAQYGRPWTELVVRQSSTDLPNAKENAVRITARWGWTTTPTPIKQACLLQASRFLARRDSPYGVAGSPEMGSEIRLLSKVDADVAVAIRPFTRWWSAA